MKKIIFLTMMFILSLSLVSASNMTTELTPTNEVVFMINSGYDGWQQTSFYINNQKGEEVYFFEDNIYHKSSEPILEIVKAHNFKPGIYTTKVIFSDEELISSFEIQRASFDWFWIIIVVITLSLFIVGYFAFHSQKPKKASKMSKKK